MASPSKCCICRKRKVAIWLEPDLTVPTIPRKIGNVIGATPPMKERKDVLCKLCITAWERSGSPRTPDALFKWVAARVYSLTVQA